MGLQLTNEKLESKIEIVEREAVKLMAENRLGLRVIKSSHLDEDTRNATGELVYSCAVEVYQIKEEGKDHDPRVMPEEGHAAPVPDRRGKITGAAIAEAKSAAHTKARRRAVLAWCGKDYELKDLL